MPRATNVAACVAAGLAGSAILVAGPLTPPAGPVTSSYKTLSEVEPRIALSAANTPGDAFSVFRITAPGSYYLTGPVSAGLGVAGIAVSASDVTIDLNGFRITCDIGAIGVQSAPNTANISVRDGVIVGGNRGIDLGDTTSARVADVTVAGYFETGIRVGRGGLVTGCLVRDVGGAGNGTAFDLGRGSRAELCVARGFGLGYFLRDSASIARCTAENQNYGTIAGVRAEGNNHILDCTVGYVNTTSIDLVGGACRVERCKIGNTPHAIVSAGAATIVGNTINSDGGPLTWGITLLGGSDVVEDNYLYRFTTSVRIITGPATVIRNRFHFGGTVAGAGLATSIAPVVGTAAALATNPVANTSQ